MNDEITFCVDPTDDELQSLEDDYQVFTEAQVGIENRRELAFLIKDGQGSILGGVKGSYGNYGWLWIGLLWVSEGQRGKGYGAALMAKIEEEAKRDGCTNAYLNSFSFQGVEFYKRVGYRVFGEMKDFPPGHCVCSLTKKLR